MSDVKWSDWLYYDETSPSCLRWAQEIRVGEHSQIVVVSVGDVAGTYSAVANQYQVCLHREQYKVHRVVWELFNGVIGNDREVDHINGDSSDNKLSNLRLVSHAVNMRNTKRRRRNTSGVTGVSKNEKTSRGNTYTYWCASWKTLDGRYLRKHFRVDQYGNDEAFRLACEYRARMIAELNKQGAGYTERHGL